MKKDSIIINVTESDKGRLLVGVEFSNPGLELQIAVHAVSMAMAVVIEKGVSHDIWEEDEAIGVIVDGIQKCLRAVMGGEKEH